MDLISLAAAKNYTNKVAAGITAARVEGNSIILTLVDGTEAKCSLPVPKDGISVVDLSIDNDGSLLCHMSDGSVIDAGYVPMADVKLEDYYTKEEMDQIIESNSGSDYRELSLGISLYDINTSTTYIRNNEKLFSEGLAIIKEMREKKCPGMRLLLKFTNKWVYADLMDDYYSAFTSNSLSDSSNHTLGFRFYEKLSNDAHADIKAYDFYISAITSSKENTFTGISYIGVVNQSNANVKTAYGIQRQYLAKTNTESFVPTGDYHPATKKYVDDSIANMDAPEMDLTNYYTKEEIDLKVPYEISDTNATISISNKTIPISASIAQQLADYVASWTNVEIDINRPVKICFGRYNQGSQQLVESTFYGHGTGSSSSSGSIRAKKYLLYAIEPESWYNGGNTSGRTCTAYVDLWISGDAETGYTLRTESSYLKAGYMFSNYALAENVLPKNNTSSYTPTGDYNPATKKYVDDAIAEAIDSALKANY